MRSGDKNVGICSGIFEYLGCNLLFQGGDVQSFSFSGAIEAREAIRNFNPGKMYMRRPGGWDFESGICGRCSGPGPYTDAQAEKMSYEKGLSTKIITVTQTTQLEK